MEAIKALIRNCRKYQWLGVLMEQILKEILIILISQTLQAHLADKYK